MTLEVISEKEAPRDTAPHRIVMTFENDHDINNAKFDVQGVTSEQIAVAVFHLSRIATQLADVRQIQSAMEAEQLAAVRRDLSKGRTS